MSSAQSQVWIPRDSRNDNRRHGLHIHVNSCSLLDIHSNLHNTSMGKYIRVYI